MLFKKMCLLNLNICTRINWLRNYVNGFLFILRTCNSHIKLLKKFLTLFQFINLYKSPVDFLYIGLLFLIRE